MIESFLAYPAQQTIQIAVIVSIGALLQTTAGFGFALFAIPLLLLSGLALHEAIIITMVCQIVQELTGLYCVKERAPFKKLLPVIVPAIVFLLAGIFILRKIESLDMSYLRRIIGTMILVSIAIELFWKPHKRGQLGVFWAMLSGAAAGLMTGTVGMTGPPIVLWVMTHNWSNQQLRTAIWTIFIFIMVPMLTFVTIVYQGNSFNALKASVLFIPLVLIFSRLGVYTGNIIPKKILRVTAFCLLIIIALSAFIRNFK